MVHIYTGILLSHIKEKYRSFVEMWMELESVIQSEVSQKQKNTYCILMHMCRIQKNRTDEPICGAGIKMPMQRTIRWAWQRGMNWEAGIDIRALSCVKQIASGNLQHSTRSSSRCSVATQMRGIRGWGPRSGYMDTYD